MSLSDYCKGKAPKPAKPGTCAVPGAGIPARQGGGECADDEDTGPKPAGITIYDENQNALATFKSGNCTAGNSFVGVASDGAWELEVGIDDFAGFDQTYPMTFGRRDPQAIISGPGGPYGNQSSAPGPAPAGAIYLHPNGDLGLGMPAALNDDASAGVAVAGVMECRYPDD